MCIPRVFFAGEIVPNTAVKLDRAASRHVLQVLRLNAGARLYLFNGKGHEYQAQLAQKEGNFAHCTVIDKQLVSRESPLRIRLAQALLRGERMDYVIQKSTEIGVSEIIPVITSRCKVKLSGERMDKRLQHWQGIIVSACEQSGRNTLPTLRQPLFLDAFATQAKGCKWIFSPRGKYQLRDCRPDNNAVTIVIGPEGGFSEEELSMLQVNGFISVRLGPRILRTETAGTVALAAINALWGDL